MKALLVVALLMVLTPAFAADPAPAGERSTLFQRLFGADQAQGGDPAPAPKRIAPAEVPVAGSKLTGAFRVTAAGGRRAVLRSDARGNALRVIADFPAAEAVPAMGTELTLTEASGFAVTHLQWASDGTLNVYVSRQ